MSNSREWILSRQADADPRIQQLSMTVENAIVSLDEKNKYTIAWGLMSQQWSDSERELDERASFLSNPYFEKLSQYQKSLAVKALSLDDTLEWSFGTQEDPGGLWAASRPTMRVATDEFDGLILSGLVGADLLQQSTSAHRRLLERDIEPLGDRLTQLSTLGAVAATAMKDSDYRLFSSEKNATFYETEREGIVVRTGVTDTIHGDFLTFREEYPVNIVDPFGRHSFFGPRPEGEHALSYHSTETNIMAALLEYCVTDLAIPPKDLYGAIAAQFAESTPKQDDGIQLYADFGDGDGDFERSHLVSRLSDETKRHPEWLMSIRAIPGTNYYFRLIGQANGIDVAMAELDDNGEDRVEVKFTIARNEISDYIVALLGMGGGRTSRRALVNVIDGLLDPSLDKLH